MMDLRRNRMVAEVSVLAAVILFAAGCGSSLIFTTYSKVGLDMSVANGAPAEAVFGYKRFEGAILPVDPSRPKEIGSVFAGMQVDNGWVDGLCIDQVFATGGAATAAAKDPSFAKTLAGECRSK